MTLGKPKNKKSNSTPEDRLHPFSRRSLLRSVIVGALGSGSIRNLAPAFIFGSGATAFLGCGSAPKTKSSKKTVCVSFYLLEDLAKKISGDLLDIQCVMPVGADVHSWEPSPRKTMELLQADAFVFNGADLETWTGKIIPQLNKKNIPIFEAAQSVVPGGVHHCEHERCEHEHDEHEHGGVDPHIWLSIRNVKKILADLTDFFVRLEPSGENVFRANFAKYAAECDALDAEFQAAASQLKNKTLIVAHRAFWYLCRDYGLEQAALEGYSAYSEPTPAQMVKIIEFIRQNQIKVIYATALESAKGTETVARETGVKIHILHPLGSLSQEQIDAGADYFSVMRENLNALKTD